MTGMEGKDDRDDSDGGPTLSLHPYVFCVWRPRRQGTDCPGLLLFPLSPRDPIPQRIETNACFFVLLCKCHFAFVLRPLRLSLDGQAGLYGFTIASSTEDSKACTNTQSSNYPQRRVRPVHNPRPPKSLPTASAPGPPWGSRGETPAKTSPRWRVIDPLLFPARHQRM
jgi:hypothetical protein